MRPIGIRGGFLHSSQKSQSGSGPLSRYRIRTSILNLRNSTTTYPFFQEKYRQEVVSEQVLVGFVFFDRSGMKGRRPWRRNPWIPIFSLWKYVISFSFWKESAKLDKEEGLTGLFSSAEGESVWLLRDPRREERNQKSREILSQRRGKFSLRPTSNSCWVSGIIGPLFRIRAPSRVMRKKNETTTDRLVLISWPFPRPSA